ncbi:hypothetical protein COY07_04125 [Candidatus Peregrinibacteria bacterium CG_4_10_14_0_2_um_filter_43_11]|nr:MAG: hypothetical protein COY07_04125 [Candidatus Peregrinibacteria bacterium CG_4_10_14_0_2_um_filter_43_11]
MREMLRKLQEWGHEVKISSIAESKSKTGIHERKEANIQIAANYLPSLTEDIEAARKAVQEALVDYGPDIIFMNTPAVFFNDVHTEALRMAIRTQRRVVMIVVDELFPTENNFPKDKVDEYYELLRSENVLTYGGSNRIASKFHQTSGASVNHLPQLFNPDEIIARRRDNRYITLVNTHPIKGVSVFNETAKALPEKEFMIVESWTDVPDYHAPTSNITKRSIFKHPKDLYEATRILLVPSLCEEGASRVAVEAMTNGIPVIAHRIGSLPEIGGKSIHLVDPPNIKGYRFEGTIMYPIIDDQDIRQTATSFVRKITEIDSDYNDFSEQAKEAGLRYCKENEEEFERLAKMWII